MKPPSLKTKI